MVKKSILNNKGLTLAEIMVAIAISVIILGAVTSLYITSDRSFKRTKSSSDVKEIGKTGMAQLEWLFQRWGTSTPCGNEDPSQCTLVNSCGSTYPPQSTMCITILERNPCDEVLFYANLYGNGFVHLPTVEQPISMNIKSCRLSTASQQNCYHIKRGAKFIRDQQNPNVYKPLIFSISGLSNNNLVCTDGTLTPNATIDPTATALNGYLKDENNNLITNYSFEGGEILLRVPHRIRLFCQQNSEDNNNLWLYMEATDMAIACNANEPAQPLIPVNSFQATVVGQGVRIELEAREPNGQIFRMQRFFGR